MTFLIFFEAVACKIAVVLVREPGHHQACHAALGIRVGGFKVRHFAAAAV